MVTPLVPLNLGAFRPYTRRCLQRSRSLEAFEEITAYCRQAFGMERSAIGFMDNERYVLMTQHRTALSWVPREAALARYAVDGRCVFMIPDTLVSPFADHPLVTGPSLIRFYAAAPLILSNGDCVGVLSLIDSHPHRFTMEDRARLVDLAHLVVFELEHPELGEPSPDTVSGHSSKHEVQPVTLQ